MSDTQTPMTNAQALELLEKIQEQAQTLVVATAECRVYLQEGGEATWDAVKAVARRTASLRENLDRADRLEDDFSSIVPF